VPIVFVHGVNTRRDPEYEESERVRDELFRKFALDGVVSDPTKVTILNPYWGGHAAKFAWKHASLPDNRFESFGTGSTVYEDILTESTPDGPWDSEAPLLEIARRDSLSRAIDTLWTAAAFTKSQQDIAEQLAALAWKAESYARAHSKPGWLATVRTDDQFADRLLQEVDQWTPVESPLAHSNKGSIESFGMSDVWNHLQTAVLNLGSAAEAAVVNPVTKRLRPFAHNRAALFLGDVFVYLNERGDVGSEGPIVAAVVGALKQAASSVQPGVDEPLIIVAHSMGGNIVYDILTYYEKNIEVDLLLTVGSQVGVFEELKLFRASDATIGSPDTVSKPRSVKRWINVLDPADVLAYSTSRIFADSTDTEFSTGAPVWSAHGMYFYRPSFHQRLAARILQE
jgi:hypothetical protein